MVILILELEILPMVKMYNVSRDGAPQARNFGAFKASSIILLMASDLTLNLFDSLH